MAHERSIPVHQRATSSLLASLHERLAGTKGAQELAEIERRSRATHVVIMGADSLDGCEVYGPFLSEDDCYSFAATASQEPNDWTPVELMKP